MHKNHNFQKKEVKEELQMIGMLHRRMRYQEYKEMKNLNNLLLKTMSLQVLPENRICQKINLNINPTILKLDYAVIVNHMIIPAKLISQRYIRIKLRD